MNVLEDGTRLNVQRAERFNRYQAEQIITNAKAVTLMKVSGPIDCCSGKQLTPDIWQGMSFLASGGRLYGTDQTKGIILIAKI